MNDRSQGDVVVLKYFVWMRSSSKHSQDKSPWISYRMVNFPFIWNWLKFYSKMAADVELLIIPTKMGSDLIMKLMFEYSKPFDGCWKVSDYTVVSHSIDIMAQIIMANKSLQASAYMYIVHLLQYICICIAWLTVNGMNLRIK